MKYCKAKQNHSTCDYIISLNSGECSAKYYKQDDTVYCKSCKYLGYYDWYTCKKNNGNETNENEDGFTFIKKIDEHKCDEWEQRGTPFWCYPKDEERL